VGYKSFDQKALYQQTFDQYIKTTYQTNFVFIAASIKILRRQIVCRQIGRRAKVAAPNDDEAEIFRRFFASAENSSHTSVGRSE
jgi:hypothetical protein